MKQFKAIIKQHFARFIDQGEEHSTTESMKQLVEKKQQKIVVLVIIAVVGIVICLFFLLKKPVPIKFTKPPDSPIEVTHHDNELQHWTVESGATLEQLKSASDQQQTNNQARDKQLSALEKSLATQSQQIIRMKQQIALGQKQGQDKLHALQMKLTQRLQRQQSIALATSNSTTQGLKNTNNLIHFSPIRVYHPPKLIHKTPLKIVMKTNPFKGWLPMGAFFRATLLNGIVAPTGSVGESNPVPVLMKVMSNAILPNDQSRFKLKGCFIMGTSYGSLSTERVAIRLARLSCINSSGTALVSTKLKGYVVDSDGKAGLRGKLINRQGSKIAMATLAGFAQGIGQMFGNAQGTTVTTPLGSAVSLSTSQKLRSAGFNGLGQAANTVAQFYVKQAEHIFPVIVVNAGRNVTIDMTQGIALHWKDMHSTKIPVSLSVTTQSTSPGNRQ